MKKLFIIMMVVLLIFACNKNEAKQEASTVISKKNTTETVTTNNKTVEQSETEVAEEVKTLLKGINPEINSITAGNDEFGFVYTEDMTKDKTRNECPKITREKFNVSVYISKIKNGEGEFIVEDYYFEEMESAVFNNTKIPGYHFSYSERLVNIAGYRFIEYITPARFSSDSILLDMEICTTTPTNKIIISFSSDASLSRIIPVEAPMYFHASNITTDTELEGWGNKAPAWNDERSEPEYNMETFCKKLIEGTCESKTAQEVFNTYQEVIKTMKIN